MKRVIVCGGRDWTDAVFVYAQLDALLLRHGFEVVIEGDAPGVDRMAGYWARKHRLDDLKFRADWASQGTRAGPIRNQRMLDEGKPDAVIAFPGGRGTADMVARAERADVHVIRIAREQSAKEQEGRDR